MCSPRVRPSLQLGRGGMIDIVSLASYPLLLLDPGYSVRRLFDAACRVAGIEPNILLESRAPHTLLALAEAGQGVAIIPVPTANRSLPAEHRSGDAPAKTAAGSLCHPVGQAASYAGLCPELLRRARRIYARGHADYAAERSSETWAVMISLLTRRLSLAEAHPCPERTSAPELCKVAAVIAQHCSAAVEVVAVGPAADMERSSAS